MISWTPAQRRAEEFAALVDDRGGAHKRGTADRNSELLDIVAAMRTTTPPAARPEFVVELRERLMLEADTVLRPDSAERRLALRTHPTKPRDRRLAVLAGTVVALGATSSVAVASQGALPGDTLYPIKRAIEGAQTTLTLDDAAKARTLMGNASDRLAEAESLAARVDSPRSAAVLPEALADFSATAEQAAQLGYDLFREDGATETLVELRDFTAVSMVRLGGMEPLLPSGAIGALNNAARTLLGIDSRIASLCPECAGTPLDVPTRLLLALRAADTGPSMPAAPSPSPSLTPDPSNEAPDGELQAVGNDMVDIDALEELLAQGVAPDSATSTEGTQERPTTRERAIKAAQDITEVLNGTGNLLLGDGGLLGPVVSPLGPILEPIVETAEPSTKLEQD